MNDQTCFVIITAAGSGSRMHSKLPKQYLPLNGKTVLEHTLTQLSSVSFFKKMILVVSEHDTRAAVMAHSFDNLTIVTGGEHRVDSVRNGLQALEGLAQADDWVFVHDAARPFISTTDLTALRESLIHEPVGAILGTPIRDTLKLCDNHGIIIKTVDRKNMWAAQTPQAFRFQILQEALSNKEIIFTDEASAVEALGLSVRMVNGSSTNFKITYPEDLKIAGIILASPF